MTQQETYHETSSGNGGLFFALGAIMVALGVIIYLVIGGVPHQETQSGETATITIQNEAPEGGASLSVTTDEAPAETSGSAAEAPAE
nr:hypothetical protein [uncultured Celeribacter sp.]